MWVLCLVKRQMDVARPGRVPKRRGPWKKRPRGGFRPFEHCEGSAGKSAAATGLSRCRMPARRSGTRAVSMLCLYHFSNAGAQRVKCKRLVQNLHSFRKPPIVEGRSGVAGDE